MRVPRAVASPRPAVPAAHRGDPRVALPRCRAHRLLGPVPLRLAAPRGMPSVTPAEPVLAEDVPALALAPDERPPGALMRSAVTAHLAFRRGHRTAVPEPAERPAAAVTVRAGLRRGSRAALTAPAGTTAVPLVHAAISPRSGARAFLPAPSSPPGCAALGAPGTAAGDPLARGRPGAAGPGTAAAAGRRAGPLTAARPCTACRARAGPGTAAEQAVPARVAASRASGAPLCQRAAWRN